jgi:2-dehydro-3-deoxy-D-arabinonate dehydratase
MPVLLSCFHVPDLGRRLGLVVDDTVYDLSSSGRPQLASLGALLQASVGVPVSQLLADVQVEQLPAHRYADVDRTPADDVAHLLAPIDRQEVWAAGVTYAWSREARVREAVAKDIYVRVYEAERPELFFKSLPEKVVGPHDWVGLRSDSRWNVPEPELALVLNPAMEIVGYTVGNDVSSRDIEGENPLYLPQAKVFKHSCALGPVIVLAEQPNQPLDRAIHLSITRAGAEVFQGETRTGQMHRTPRDLADYLGRHNDFPWGAILLTGTGVVPPDDFTLQDGDMVIIEIEDIGILRNPVAQM